MRTATLAATPLLFLLLACGEGATETATATAPPSTPPPTAVEAKELIARSQPFGDFQFTDATWTFRTDAPLTHETQLAMARDLEKAGWLRVNENRVELTDKSRGDKRFVLRPNGTLDLVPLARKELLEVTSVEPTADGATATITWRWIPNEVGDSVTSGPLRERFDETHTARVTMQRGSDGWEVWDVTASDG